MRKKSWVKTSIGSTLLLISLLAFGLPTNDTFQIENTTIDNGGETSTGGGFSITGSVAQFDAEPVQMTGGSFIFSGGFWARAMDQLFANGFEE